jgi:plasmid maintenance system antidote protein VapI
MTLQIETESPGTGAEALKRLLAENDRDMAWLARRTNRSKSYIWRVVQGERPLTRPLAAACAEVFGVSIEELLPGGDA